MTFAFSPWQWAAVVFAGFCIGLSKTGMSGITTVIIPVMALIFGAKESTGVILPMLCFGDVLAVLWYRRSADWKHIVRLLPWAVAGFAVALAVDRFVPERLFKILIALCIIGGLVVMLWNDLRTRGGAAGSAPASWWFAAVFGILGGFSTMIGNAAGPIMSVFLLSMRLPKKSFVGTGAWFYLLVNVLKLPIQHFVWHNITLGGLVLDAMMVPVIIIGAVMGVFLVKMISEKHYRILIYALTVLSAALLFI
ncbi:MAG: sulfite exporter TauE/SafE family protein [Treponema sp.]|nr:sulfite exporter TauE/SafE family protein [Treponema sp.]